MRMPQIPPPKLQNTPLRLPEYYLPTCKVNFHIRQAASAGGGRLSPLPVPSIG